MNKGFLKKIVHRHTGLLCTLFCLIPFSLSAQETQLPSEEPAQIPSEVKTVVIDEQTADELLNKLSAKIDKSNKEHCDRIIRDFVNQATALASKSDDLMSQSGDTISLIKNGQEKTSGEIAALVEQNDQTYKQLNSLMSRVNSMENKLSKEIIGNSAARNHLQQEEDNRGLYAMVAAIFALISSFIGIYLIYLNNHPKGSSSKLEESINRSLKDLTKQIANITSSGSQSPAKAKVAAPTAPVDNGASQKIESSLKAVVKKLESLESNIETLKETSKEQVQLMEQPEEANPLWPWLVEKGNPLEGWKDRLIEDMNNNNKTAFDLYIAFFEAFKTLDAKSRVTEEQANEIINRVATSLYHYLYEKEDLVSDDLIDLPTQWVKAMRTLIEPVIPSLEIKATYPGESLNTDTMEKVDGGSQLTVQKPYSWTISDKSNGTVRIITRAQVATA